MKKISKMIGATMLCAGMMFSSAVCASGGDENNAFADGAYKAKVMESIGHGKRVYFAGPLFNQAEKDFNLAMTKILEEHGYQVFLPQRDGILSFACLCRSDWGEYSAYANHAAFGA